MQSTALVWDSDDTPPNDSNGYTLLWRSYKQEATQGIFSVPNLVEKNSLKLRSLYLDWVYEIGRLHINGSSVVDHLKLRQGFSYWWMTLIAEKCNFSKSPQIDDAIKLLAFDDWADGRELKLVKLVGSSKPLAECLRLWCKKSNVPFVWEHVPKLLPSKPWSRHAFQALPAFIQAVAWLLFYLLRRWPLRGVGLKEWVSSLAQLTFVSYSDNLLPRAIQSNLYESLYWANLPAVLKQESCKTNWLHIYVQDNQLPTTKKARSVFEGLNKNERGQQCHATLDTFLSIGVILAVIRDWFFLLLTGVRLTGKLSRQKNSSIDLWPLFFGDWQASFWGVAAISNVLTLNLFEAALNCLPQQRHGVYLKESQGWEYGFIHAWKTAGHGSLIGASHSTLRFWDLRHFFDPRSYQKTGNNDLPMPDIVACNGPVMRATYEQGRYPAENLVDVEALRYLHLGQKQAASEIMPNRTNEPLRLLILGDYLVSNTQYQMRLLEQAVSLVSKFMHIIVKPHPNSPIWPTDYPALHMRVSREPIAKLLADCDVAYASAATSAALDAFCAGVPVISVLNPNTLNLSPLRGCEGAVFACNSEELALALTSVINGQNKCNTDREFFSTNSDLPKWQKLLLA